jgi:accessory gene regulator protein AgrB
MEVMILYLSRRNKSRKGAVCGEVRYGLAVININVVTLLSCVTIPINNWIVINTVK